MALDPGHPWPGRRSIFLFMQQRRSCRGDDRPIYRSAPTLVRCENYNYLLCYQQFFLTLFNMMRALGTPYS